jgi:hypothetical protein
MDFTLKPHDRPIYALLRQAFANHITSHGLDAAAAWICVTAMVERVVMKWTRPLCGSASMSQNDFKTSEII